MGQRIKNFLFTSVDAASLGVYRAVFGLLMMIEVIRYFWLERIEVYYLKPGYFFGYPPFDFIKPWPGDAMYWHFALMGIFALALALGLFTRVAAAGFFLCYSYVFLIDMAHYNNHYYLICLLSFLFIVVDSGARFSLSRRFHPGSVPRWQPLLFQLQFVIVFFYGGVAKLNSDWLRGEPLRTWLSYDWRQEYFGSLGAFIASDPFVYFLSYTGLFFDLSIGFLLLMRRTRSLAIGLNVIFHLTNSFLFKIGVFPYLMIASLLIFLEPDWPKHILRKIQKREEGPLEIGSGRPSKTVLIFLGVYLGFQTLMPLRHFLYKGDVAWTEEGHRFSWRMKLRSKQGKARFLVVEKSTNKRWFYHLDNELAPQQIEKMATHPDMIWQFAKHVAEKASLSGIKDPAVYANVKVRLNDKAERRLIDPFVDLAAEDYGFFSSAKWILPLSK